MIGITNELIEQVAGSICKSYVVEQPLMVEIRRRIAYEEKKLIKNLLGKVTKLYLEQKKEVKRWEQDQLQNL